MKRFRIYAAALLLLVMLALPGHSGQIENPGVMTPTPLPTPTPTPPAQQGFAASIDGGADTNVYSILLNLISQMIALG